MRYVLFFPKAGYISDPMLATQNIQSAARRRGADLRHGRTGERRAEGSDGHACPGWSLESGRTLHARHRRERVRPSFVQGQRDGGRGRRHEHQDPGPQGRGRARPLAGGVRLRGERADLLRCRHRRLLAARGRQQDPDRQRGAGVRSSGLGRPRRLRTPRSRTRPVCRQCGPPSGFLPWACPTGCRASRTCTTPPTTGSRSTISPTCPGFYMAVGTSGNQFKNAPVVGMMMAALVDYVESGNDHDASPLQYPLPNMDFTLDMSVLLPQARDQPGEQLLGRRLAEPCVTRKERRCIPRKFHGSTWTGSSGDAGG